MANITNIFYPFDLWLRYSIFITDGLLHLLNVKCVWVSIKKWTEISSITLSGLPSPIQIRVSSSFISRRVITQSGLSVKCIKSIVQVFNKLNVSNGIDLKKMHIYIWKLFVEWIKMDLEFEKTYTKCWYSWQQFDCRVCFVTHTHKCQHHHESSVYRFVKLSLHFSPYHYEAIDIEVLDSHFQGMKCVAVSYLHPLPPLHWKWSYSRVDLYILIKNQTQLKWTFFFLLDFWF